MADTGRPHAEQSPPTAPVAPAPAAPFFQVSIAKLVVLSICTFGIYELYWFYKNWTLVRAREGSKISPVPRAFFAQFFCYALFRRIRDYPVPTAAPGKTGTLPAGALALAFFASMVAAGLPDPYWLVSLVSAFVLVPVQNAVRRICVDVAPHADRNARFTPGNFVAIAAGCVVLVLGTMAAFEPTQEALTRAACPDMATDARLSNEERIARCTEVIDAREIPDGLLGRVLLVRGVAYAESGDHDSAIRDFDRAAELRPDALGPLRLRARSLGFKGERDLAIKTYGRVLVRKPDDVEALASRSGLYVDGGEYERALRDCGRALELDPQRTGAAVVCGLAQLRQGRHDEALRYLARARELDPTDALTHYYVGESHRARKRWAEGIAAYSEALRMEPSAQQRPYVLEARGTAYLESGRYDRAVDDYSEALAHRPDNAILFNNRCWARAVANVALDLALADCNEALRLKPDSAHAFNSRALVDLRLGQPAQALADADASLALDATSAWSFYLRGLARSRLGSAAEARRDFDRAAELDPTMAERFAGYGVTP